MGSFSYSRRQLGQATVEYALLLGVAAMIGLAFVSSFNTIMGQSLTTFNAILEKELVTAGFDEAANRVWSN